MTNNYKIKLNDLLRSLAGNGLVITDQRKLNKQIEVLFGCDSNVEITVNRKPERVLIMVDGGVVQDVFSTSEDIKFTILDRDNLEGGQEEPYELDGWTTDIKTEQEILDEINSINKEILENNDFYNRD